MPAPFGPINPTISPSPTSNETSSTATIPPNRSVTCSTSSRATAGDSTDGTRGGLDAKLGGIGDGPLAGEALAHVDGRLARDKVLSVEQRHALAAGPKATTAFGSNGSRAARATSLSAGPTIAISLGVER